MKRKAKTAIWVVVGIFVALCIGDVSSRIHFDRSGLTPFTYLGAVAILGGILYLLWYVSDLKNTVKKHENIKRSSFVILLDRMAPPLSLTLYGDSPYSKYTDFLCDFSMSEDEFNRFAISAIDDSISAKYSEYYNSDEYKQALKESREFEAAFFDHLNKMDESH